MTLHFGFNPKLNRGRMACAIRKVNLMLKSSVFKRLDMNLMSRLSIRQRMIVLVSLTMLGFAIVGAIVWVNGARTERAFAQTRHFDEVAESILKIKPSVVDMRRLQETFLAERKPQFAAAFRAVAETAEAELESIQSRTTSDEISLEQTIGSFARYLVLFDQVVAAQEKLGFNIEVVANVETGEGFSHAQNLQVVIDNAAHKLEKRFKEELEFEESPVIFGLLVRLYETRRTERKLLARGDQDLYCSEKTQGSGPINSVHFARSLASLVVRQSKE